MSPLYNAQKEPKRRLSGLTVNFVSLVPRGANPGAEILITKENEKMSDIQLNIDPATIGEIITKALSGVSSDSKAPVAMTEENMKKAFDLVKDDLSVIISKAVEDSNKACGDKKKEDPMPEEKKNDPEKPEDKMKKSMEDETMVIGEHTIRKSIVGDDVYNSMKSMQVELAKQRFESDIDRLTITVEKEYPNIPGAPREKALLLKQINGMPKNIADLAKSILAQAESNLSTKINKENGTATIPAEVGVGKEAEEKLDTLAKEFAKANNVPFAKAYQAVLESEEGGALYEKTLNR